MTSAKPHEQQRPLNAADVALQMYTVREQFDADPHACLQDVADAGYPAVEFAGFGSLTPSALRQALDRNGLRALSSHIDIPEFDDLDTVMRDHESLGCTTVVIQQAGPSDFIDVPAVQKLADRCNRWGDRLAQNGFQLGYHGYHDFDREFAVVDGVSMYDRLMDLTDPALLKVQLDTFWVHHVGDTPAAALARYAGRVPMLHLKEVSGEPGGGDAPIGQGSTDWSEVLSAAAAAGVQWLIVEQEDRPAQAPQDIRTSLEYLHSLLQPAR